MTNEEYWKNRFEILKEKELANAEKYIETLEKQYKKAYSKIEEQISKWYTRLAANNQVSLEEAKKLLSADELEEFHWTVEEYIKKGQENELDQKWIKQLENASARVHINKLDAMKLQIQAELEQLYQKQNKDVTMLQQDIYDDSYYHSAYEIQKGVNTAWKIPVLPKTLIDKVISKPWTTDNMTFSDRIWKNKEELNNTIQTELTQALIRGRGPNEVIDVLKKKFDVSRGKAARLVMTESAFFSSAGQKKCFEDLDVEQYEIVATLDSHTSEICQEMDGKVFAMKDYAVGVTAPPFHVWCRSTTVPYFEDNYTERIARDPDTGETYYVPSNIKYKEWKEKYVDKTSTNSENDGTIEIIPNFIKNTMKQGEKVYTEKEIKYIARQTNELATKYTNNTTKWSGKIIISNRKTNAKLWNCNIEIENKTSPHTILHEQLHAHSISYYDVETYKKYKRIEEATVELYAKEICKKENIINIPSKYDKWVNNLIEINNSVKIGKNNFEFAKKLFDKPVIERLDFLEEEIQKYTKNKTIEEATKLNGLMEELYVK